MTPITPTKLYNVSPDNNMIDIPLGIFFYNNSGGQIELSGSDGVDVMYPFEMYPQNNHYQYMTINRFFIDKYSVTCLEYKKYLDSSNYKPIDSYNFLKNWNYNKSTGIYIYPNGYENKPVTYISLNEARLFCKYNGKRLIHSFEWQYAAQGNTTYDYPWGNIQNMGINFPQTQHGRTIPGPADVDEFVPKGDSIFGVSDLIGNIWQYTDEFTDDHTRSVIVRGS
eukprot:321979_1